MIIIPAIDIIGEKCVRLFHGDYAKQTLYQMTPLESALKWQKQGARLLHIVDLDGAKSGMIVNLEAIKKICLKTSLPCELGGGIRTLETAQIAFDAGILRVVIGTAAIKDPNLIPMMLKKFGADKIVLGLDARDGKVAFDGWLRTTSTFVLDFAKQFAQIGVKRFIYTDISKDGALEGPNLEVTKTLCSKLHDSSIIASGGIGSIEHIKSLLEISKTNQNLEGVIIGKALYENKITLKEIALLE